MDVTNSVVDDTMCDFLHRTVSNCVGSVIPDLHIYYGDSQTSADQTGHAEYAFIDVHELESEKHTLNPCAYLRNVSTLVEVQVSRNHIEQGKRILANIERTFQRRLEAPNGTVVESIVPSKVHNQTGTRFALNITLNYTYTLEG